MAFTVDKHSASTGSIPYSGINKHYLAQVNVDFTVTANQLAQTNTMGLIIVPAKTMIRRAYFVVNTVNAGVTDIDIGVYDLTETVVDVDGFMDGATIEAAGYIEDLAGETYSPQDGTDGYYSSAGCILGLINNDATSITLADITFFAECVYLGP